MLPLHNENGDGLRMIEYYRGMLLALNQLNAEGIKTEVSAWNVPIDADIRTTLLKDGVQNLNIVFGPLYSNMVKPLGDYCRSNDIKMVIPFSITGNDVAENSQIFQVYQSPEELNTKAVAAFMERFPNHHPIFINCNDDTSDKAVFTSSLRSKLDAVKRKYNLTNVNTPQQDFAKAFSANQPNVIVLNTAKSPKLNAVFAKLDSLSKPIPVLPFPCSDTMSGSCIRSMTLHSSSNTAYIFLPPIIIMLLPIAQKLLKNYISTPTARR
jgi:hypothetical protein